MDLTDLEMFLTIVSTKSISKTAEAMFLSQPTISHRLKAMEKELDFPLIVRSKGLKQIEVTPEGADFIPIARRMISLWKETRHLKRSRDRLPLTVGCADSVNAVLLAPFYRSLAGELDLNIRTRQSSDLYGMLDSHDVDAALVFYHLYYRNIDCQRVFQEKLYLVQTEHPAVTGTLVRAEDLDPEQELYLKWDDRFQMWHEQRFPSSTRPRAAVDTVALLRQMWQGDGRGWIIAPESVVWELARSGPVYVSALRNPPPDRRCYEISHHTPLAASQRALEIFDRRLTEYLAGLRFDIPLGRVWQPD